MIITLTDFGDSEYLGVMKGVIATLASNAKVIDLYNHIEPQNIRQAAWILLKNYSFFPKKSIFLCVVDPGVGGKRKAIIIKTKNYFFVGPDNGILAPACESDGIISIHELSTSNAHPTFHGRDVFAVAAAHMEKRRSMGKQLNTIQALSLCPKTNVGEIMHSDAFGNIITNLPHKNKPSYIFKINGKSYKLSFCKTYSEGRNIFLVESSYRTLEITKKNASAIKSLKVRIGDKVQIL